MFITKSYTKCLRLKLAYDSQTRFLRNKCSFKPICLYKNPPTEKYKLHRYIADYRRKWNELVNNEIGITNTFICFKYMRLIKAAVREFGPIIEENQKLASLIESAQQHDLSQDFIDYALKISVDVRAKVGMYELQLPSNCHFIIQYEDIDTSATKHHLLEMSENHDVTLIKGDVKWPQYFDQKGVLLVKCDTVLPFAEEAEGKNFALRIGAENIIKEIDAEGLTYWKFICEPGLLHDVKKQLNEENGLVEEAFIGYIPKTKVVMSSYVKQAVCNVLFDLCKIPTIDNVYDNIM